MNSSSGARNKDGKNLFLPSVAITPVICCIFVLVLMLLCCSVTKFPLQIFGSNEDHFRAHVISPIPKSVDILDVEVDDLIIHPDVAYYFRFSINRDDLEEIILYRSLERTTGECSVFPSPDLSFSGMVENFIFG